MTGAPGERTVRALDSWFLGAQYIYTIFFYENIDTVKIYLVFLA